MRSVARLDSFDPASELWPGVALMGKRFVSPDGNTTYEFNFFVVGWLSGGLAFDNEGHLVAENGILETSENR